MDDEEDLPPALSSLEDQLRALAQVGVDQRGADDSLPLASTTLVGTKNANDSKPAVIKRGFFDAKPKGGAPAKSISQPPLEQKEMTVLKGKKDKLGNAGPSIPDFMRVEPSEQAKRLEEVKGKLVSALQPTPAMIEKLGKNPALLSGFEDPEVMAAVGEISKDAKNMLKYKDNAKVQQFYQAMALFAGNTLEQMENKPL